MFVVSMGLALIGYSLYPTAPPRMFPEYGFVDTLNDFSDVNHDSALAKIFINPYAAVPSMHCAFAMMIGATGIMVCRHWWSKAWWAFWPLLVSWVDDRHRQPLLGRRRARLDGRARAALDRPAARAGPAGSLGLPRCGARTPAPQEAEA